MLPDAPMDNPQPSPKEKRARHNRVLLFLYGCSSQAKWRWRKDKTQEGEIYRESSNHPLGLPLRYGRSRLERASRHTASTGVDTPY